MLRKDAKDGYNFRVSQVDARSYFGVFAGWPGSGRRWAGTGAEAGREGGGFVMTSALVVPLVPRLTRLVGIWARTSLFR